MEKHFNSFSDRMTLAVLFSCFVLTLSVLIWGMNRGLDITDEGAWLLGYRHPMETLTLPSSFCLVIGKILGPFEPGIVTFRLSRLVLSLVSTAALSFGFWKWSRPGISEGLRSFFALKTIFLFFAAGNFLSYSWSYQSISYNELNNFFILFAAGALLWLVSESRAGLSVEEILAGGVMGFSAGFDLFIKFPSAVVLSVTILLVLLFGTKSAFFVRKVVWMACFAAGFLLAIGVFFLFFCPPDVWLPNFIQACSGWSKGGHPPRELLGGYVRHAKMGSAYLAANYLPPFAALGLTALFLAWAHEKGTARFRRIFFPAAVLMLAAFIYQAFRLHWHQAGETTYKFTAVFVYIAVLAAQAGLFFLSCVRKGLSGLLSCADREKIAVALVLLFLPFIGVFGTNNVPSVSLLMHLAPWFALLLLFAAMIYRAFPSGLLTAVFMLIAVFFASSQTLHGFIFRPYRLPENLLKQTERVENMRSLEGMRFDAGSKKFFEEIRSLVFGKAGFKEGDPVIALYDLGGVVYALGGVSPGKPWFHNLPSEQFANMNGIRKASPADLSRALFLTSRLPRPEFDDCLREKGIFFPEDYVEAGRVAFPYKEFFSKRPEKITVWVPRYLEDGPLRGNDLP